jgi:hypothetical protein
MHVRANDDASWWCYPEGVDRVLFRARVRVRVRVRVRIRVRAQGHHM